MSQQASNKALVILQTALLVSIISSISAGYYYTFFQDQSWSDFLYTTYLILVNKTILPVGVATIIFCLLIKSNKSHDFISMVKTAGLLSIITLLLLFIWNALDVCLSYEYCMRQGIFYQNIEQQFLLGLFLCLPISLLIISVFSILNK